MMWFLALFVLVALSLLFAFIANFMFKRSSPVRRAGYAAVLVGVLVTAPAVAALIMTDAEPVALIAMGVGAVISSAIAFPIALLVTKRRPVSPNPSVFD